MGAQDLLKKDKKLKRCKSLKNVTLFYYLSDGTVPTVREIIKT